MSASGVVSRVDNINMDECFHHSIPFNPKVMQSILQHGILTPFELRTRLALASGCLTPEGGQEKVSVSTAEVFQTKAGARGGWILDC